jgi:DDE superfamily endonuclease
MHPDGFKKSQLKPWLKKMWCIGTMSGEYLSNMEDILDLYAQPAEVGVARICFDERPCQLLGHVLTPIPAKPNSTRKEHQEYIRNGVCNVLLAYDIDTGQRYLKVTSTKTKVDYAEFMYWLSHEHYSTIDKIKLVQDNYSVHSYGAFYENLPVEEARKLRKKLEFHFTPKHASWLNMAEIEFSALARQCLDRRIDNQKSLEAEALFWQNARNEASTKVNWSFTTRLNALKMSLFGPVRASIFVEKPSTKSFSAARRAVI